MAPAIETTYLWDPEFNPFSTAANPKIETNHQRAYDWTSTHDFTHPEPITLTEFSRQLEGTITLFRLALVKEEIEIPIGDDLLELGRYMFTPKRMTRPVLTRKQKLTVKLIWRFFRTHNPDGSVKA